MCSGCWHLKQPWAEGRMVCISGISPSRTSRKNSYWYSVHTPFIFWPYILISGSLLAFAYHWSLLRTMHLAYQIVIIRPLPATVWLAQMAQILGLCWHDHYRALLQRVHDCLLGCLCAYRWPIPVCVHKRLGLSSLHSNTKTACGYPRSSQCD